MRRTTYSIAVNYCNNSLVLCNNIAEVDPSVYDNARFEWGEETEIFQWFVTDCSKSEVEFLEKSFGLLFTYSDKLDVYVLCVAHCGTSWDYVECDCYNDEIPDGNLKK
jgi:hypothetical protein